MNVTGGVSLDPDSAVGQRELLRSGYAYVGVDAQALGVNVLRGWDPPALRLARPPRRRLLLRDLRAGGEGARPAAPVSIRWAGSRPVRVLAMGESQSGGRLNTYVNSVHPQVVPVFDGFMIGGSNSMIADLAGLDVPVLRFNSDFDVGGNAQPDGDLLPRLGDGWLGAQYLLLLVVRVGGDDARSRHPVRRERSVGRLSGEPLPEAARIPLGAASPEPVGGPRHRAAERTAHLVHGRGARRGRVRELGWRDPAASGRGARCRLQPGTRGANSAGSTQYFDAAALAALYPRRPTTTRPCARRRMRRFRRASSCPPTGCSARPSISHRAAATSRSPGSTTATPTRWPRRSTRPFAPNTGQGDAGGVASAVADGIGDACQCGDVSGNGIVDRPRASAIKRDGLGVQPNPLFPRARQLRRHGQRRLQRAGRERGEAHCARPAPPRSSGRTVTMRATFPCRRACERRRPAPQLGSRSTLGGPIAPRPGREE